MLLCSPMYKMFASESRETVFPYHYFWEIIVPRDGGSFLNFSAFILV